MKQIIHIFRKDVRRHWLEIAVSLALLIGTTWDEPRHWRLRTDILEDVFHERLSGALIGLLLLSWALLIVRVIQGERLVGDRQYWITRPYEWDKLLAAKVLFVAAFVSIPLFIADLVLLAQAGFRPELASLPGLLGLQMGLVVIFLPIAALAAVTRSIAQLLLALLATGAFIAGVAILAAYIPNEGFSTGSDNLQEAVMFAGCVLAILLQYARRQTSTSRALLVGAALTILLLVVATPYRTLVDYEYPLLHSTDPLPVQLALNPAKRSPQEVEPDQKKEVEIQIPLLVFTEMADNSVASLDGKMLTLEARDGSHWSSGWTYGGLRLLPDQQHAEINFGIKKKFFEKIQSSDVKASLSFAVTVWHAKDAHRIVVSDKEFAVPGLGFCSLDREYLSDSVQCRYLLRNPTILASVAFSTLTCPASEDDPKPQGKFAHDFDGSSDTGPVSPIGTLNLRFGNWDGLSDYTGSSRLCPGTPITLSMPDALQKGRLNVEIDGFHVADYRAGNVIRLSR